MIPPRPTRRAPWWHYPRLFVLLFAFLALGAYLLTTLPPPPFLGRWWGRNRIYSALVTDGNPIVAAIAHFRAATGLWPEYLDDLSPTYLPHAPNPAWYYTLPPDDLYPSLAHATGEPRTHVGFDFSPPPHGPAWHVFGPTGDRILGPAPAGVTPTTLPATLPSSPAVLSAELHELDRRIVREPTLMGHRRAKASLLCAAGRLDEAQQTITAARTAFPDHPWPRLALALLRLPNKPATSPAASTPASHTAALPPDSRAFIDWVHAHPSFTRDDDLLLLYRRLGDPAGARAAVEDALTRTPVLEPEDPNTLAFYFWDMTRWALRNEQWPLVMRLTEMWSASRTAKNVRDASDLPLRAAAQLATGYTAAAAETLRTLDNLKPAPPLWVRNLDALRSAVAQKDSRFRFNPGNDPPEYAVFALPP